MHKYENVVIKCKNKTELKKLFIKLSAQEMNFEDKYRHYKFMRNLMISDIKNYYDDEYEESEIMKEIQREENNIIRTKKLSNLIEYSDLEEEKQSLLKRIQEIETELKK